MQTFIDVEIAGEMCHVQRRASARSRDVTSEA